MRFSSLAFFLISLLSPSWITQTSNNWSPLERYFQGLSFGRNSFFLLKYFRRYISLKLTYVTRYLSDSAVQQFSSYIPSISIMDHPNIKKLVTVGKIFSWAIIWGQFCLPSSNALGDTSVWSWCMWPDIYQNQHFGISSYILFISIMDHPYIFSNIWARKTKLRSNGSPWQYLSNGGHLFDVLMIQNRG